MGKLLKRHMAFVLVLMLILAVFLGFSFRKSGMFIDEIYTYGLSNSYYSPFLIRIENPNIIDTVFTRADFYEYVAVGEQERFAFDSVYYNQTMDVHPPLYYFLIHGLSSLHPGAFSKWTGLCLNALLFAVTLFLLYMIPLRLKQGRTIAVITVILYGLSTMGMSTALMIRMYILLTLFTVALIYLVICYWETSRPLYAVASGFCIFLGFLTNYYFSLYAFFLCAFLDIWFLLRKKYKNFLVFSAAALSGVAGFLLCWPSFFVHMTRDHLVSGTNAVSNLSQMFASLDSLFYYVKVIVKGVLPSVLTVIFLTGVLFGFLHQKAELWKKIRISPLAGIIVVPAFLTLLLVAAICPVFADRYVYNIAPVFVLLIAFILDLLVQSGGNAVSVRSKRMAVLIPLVVSLLVMSVNEPDYLYEEHNGYKYQLAEHEDSFCVFFQENYVAPITQSLIQLMYFDEVFVTNRSGETLQAYLAEKGNPEEVVVFVDTSEFWSSGFDADQMLSDMIAATDYNSYTHLYTIGLASAYVVSVD